MCLKTRVLPCSSWKRTAPSMINAECEKLTGYAKSEVQGKKWITYRA
ncbi:MAG: hypothetical protein R2941_04955 [Desulfobacterales bacterium]